MYKRQVIGLIDESGKRINTYLYTPDGRTRTGTVETLPQPFRFAGGHLDPTGLYHLGARYYDPQTVRFTQPDPSGQEVNPYLYAEGDPVNRIDPGGLASVNVSGEVCYYVCVGGGANFNVGSRPDAHPYVSFGFGNPGASGDVSLGSGKASKGWSVPAQCSAGPFSGSVDLLSGTPSASAGTGMSTPKCSVRASYTW